MEYMSFQEPDILERVDEYSLYCFYLGFEPLIGAKYRSPIREGDDDPSFGLFTRKWGTKYAEFLWKDAATGLHGPLDVFDLVATLYGIERHEAYHKICCDHGLGGAIPDEDGIRKLIDVEPKFMEPIDIKIVSRALTKRDILYWSQYHVTPQLLREYNTTSLDAYFLTKTQSIPAYPKGGLGFAYRVLDKYQLYFPMLDRKLRWRNNWTERCIPGLEQLKRHDTLVITKAMKDVLCLASFGIDTVCPRGENVMLPQQAIDHFLKRYKRVVTLFDNDGKHKAGFYTNIEEVHIPLSTGCKDPTDFCSRNGAKQTHELLKDILWIQ